MAQPAAGFRFPIDSVTALGYVRKAGKAEQALARTEEVVSSDDVQPMGYTVNACGVFFCRPYSRSY